MLITQLITTNDKNSPPLTVSQQPWPYPLSLFILRTIAKNEGRTSQIKKPKPSKFFYHEREGFKNDIK